MEYLYPSSFKDLLSSLLVIIACVLIFISFSKTIRQHTSRYASILLIAGIALFANNGYVYFAAVFIIATAVTELEFLQTLAAIIKGGEHYFKYKEKFAGISMKEEVLSNNDVKHEVPQSESHNDSAYRNIPSIAVEQVALALIESKINKPIKRNLILSSGAFEIQLDGLASSRKGIDTIYEVKIISNEKALNRLIENFHYFRQTVLYYETITERTAKFHLIIVLKDASIVTDEMNTQINEQFKINHMQGSLFILTYKQLGFDM